MSRSSDIVFLWDTNAAASAATGNIYLPLVGGDTANPSGSPQAFIFEGFAWLYLAAEANTDNTLDFVITHDGGDGTFGTTVHTNANAVGLLDSAAVGEVQINRGDAASGGAAAAAVTPTQLRIPVDRTIRVAVTTAGTGTIPAIKFGVYGHYV